MPVHLQESPVAKLVAKRNDFDASKVALDFTPNSSVEKEHQYVSINEVIERKSI